MQKIAFHTLGCKLNFSETATLSRLFIDQGFEKVGFNQQADTYVINTCSVTGTADKKCKQAIRKAIKLNPKATVIVTGCFAQLKPKEIVNIPGVSLVLGANEKLNFNKYLEQINTKKAPEVHSCEISEVNNFFSAYSLNERTRSFLKVQDGCDYPCTYCTIPKARGKSRNGTIAEMVEKAKDIAAHNVKEIILTGINIGDFGKSTGEKFIDLIQALDKVEGIERIRISSIEPNLLTDEIIQYVADSKKIMPHFHIPLQSGSNSVLKTMKRRYNTSLFKEKVELINKLIPNAAIGVDVIVGFPSESDENFAEAETFINSLDIMNLHVFTYSERADTPAIDIKPAVLGPVRTERSRKFHILSDKKQRFFNERFLNTERLALMETGNNKGIMYGFTDNYIKVELPFDGNLKNAIIKVKLKGILENGNMEVELVK